MSKIDERTFARGRRLNPDKDIAQAAADFYLLEHLGHVRGDRWAALRLEDHEQSLAKDFAAYLDMAVGGELRYAKRYLAGLPRELEPYFREVSDTGRGKAWLVWTVIRRKFGLRALELAEQCFFAPGWQRNFGGEPWGYICRTLRAYLEGTRKTRIFVDSVLNLEHCTGSCLNKLWCVSNLPRVLDAHGRDDYPTLLAACSPDVRKRWRFHEWQTRTEHDPIWLGVQVLDTIDDVA